MLAPFQQVAGAPQPQRDLVAFGVLLQYPQIELHQVPADDGVGIVTLQPCVQPFQQLRAAGAVFQIEIQRLIAAVGRPQHVDLPLAAAFQRDGVKLAVGGGFDIQRHQF
ncbi:hypothetical protein RF55_22604 [Lasius niger]|uniref:Uncharacterized protein n=1 Tax=Lasius niger TaxID=67767 RepID=A0A0J7JX95_LASNI|nr:hypothetical protein RF55_22604 [Lasius niger]